MNTGAPWPDLGEAERRVRVMHTRLNHKWHEHMESRMHPKLHVRPLHLCSDLVGLRLPRRW